MTSSSPHSSSTSSSAISGGVSGARRRGKKPTTTAAIVVAILIGGYSMLRPTINQATGWNLPAVGSQNVATNDGPASVTVASEPRETSSQDVVARKDTAPKPQTESAKPTPSPSRPSAGPLASKMPTSRNAAPAATSSRTEVDGGDSSLKYGLLREMQPDRFMSPAGLLYTPGSAEGHRLKHLERHTADQPGRPGKHGVFDGGMEKALAVIDQAYTKAKAGVRTTKSTDQGRTIYTVDMGKRIGFVGGREGNQKRKPMARRVRMVLDGNRVITAYPM